VNSVVYIHFLFAKKHNFFNLIILSSIALNGTKVRLLITLIWHSIKTNKTKSGAQRCDSNKQKHVEKVSIIKKAEIEEEDGERRTNESSGKYEEKRSNKNAGC